MSAGAARPHETFGKPKHTNGNGRLLTAEEVADMLGVPKTWVYAETRAGRMPHVALGRYRRYHRDALAAWVAERERGPVSGSCTGGSPHG